MTLWALGFCALACDEAGPAAPPPPDLPAGSPDGGFFEVDLGMQPDVDAGRRDAGSRDAGAQDAASADAATADAASGQDALPGPDVRPGEDAGDAGPSCEPLEYSAAQAHRDLDLEVVELSAAITLGGRPLPDASASRGALELESSPGAVVTYELGAQGLRTLDVRLPPGVYEARYRPDRAACAEPGPWPFPCETRSLGAPLALSTSRAVGLDIPLPPGRARVLGTLTLDGEPFPNASSDRGALVFSSTTGAFSWSLGHSGPVEYELLLPLGTYEVRFSGQPGHCVRRLSPVPCSDAVLDPTFVLRSDGSADFDLRSVRVQGEVRVNGAPMASATGSRGRLVFVGAGSRSPTGGLGSTGAARYDVRLSRGTYDVEFLPDGCFGATPCMRGQVRTGVRLDGDLALDLDLPMVTVSGTVRANGAPLPDAAAPRGRLRFVAGPARGTTPSLSPTGPGSYQIGLFPGTYDVLFAGNPSLCEAGPPGLPCNTGVVASARTLQAPAASLDVDLPVVRVDGALTVGGAPFSDEAVERGALLFEGSGGRFETPSFGATGPARFSVSLLSGTYDVVYRPNEALCDDATTPLPCRPGASLRTGLALTRDATLPLDLDVVRVSGELLMNGAPLPDATASRGEVVFNAGGTERAATSLSPSGPARFSLVLERGAYDLAFRPNRDACLADASTAGPCLERTLATGQVVAGPASLLLDYRAVRARGRVTANRSSLPVGPPGALELTSATDGTEARIGLQESGEYAAWLPADLYGVRHLPPEDCAAGGGSSCAPQPLTGSCPPSTGGGGAGSAGCVTQLPAFRPGEVSVLGGGGYEATYTVLSSVTAPSGDQEISVLLDNPPGLTIIDYLLRGNALLVRRTMVLVPGLNSVDYAPPYPRIVVPVCVGDAIPVATSGGSFNLAYTLSATAYETLALGTGTVRAIKLEYTLNNFRTETWWADGLGEVRIRTPYFDLRLTEHRVP